MYDLSGKTREEKKKFVLAVVPGDMQIDFEAVKSLFSGTYITFAPDDIGERLAESVKGTVLPFPFNPELLLIVDPSLENHEYIYFNAARLDESLELKTSDYLRILELQFKPRFERIAK